ncbi:hypothetical protein QTP86_019723 [Hemibagrus guttatus]|nr:hypothetical protein QTP86_019723 [Hemibagrus guttatus]
MKSGDTTYYLNGKAFVLKCLLAIHKIFRSNEPAYILNDLYITDYCIWVQRVKQKLRQALGGEVVLPNDWETTAEVIRETGRKVLGVSSGRRKEDKETWWWNEEVQDSIQRKRLDKKKWDMDRTEENRIQGVTAQEYKELQRRVKREVSKAKQKAYDELYTRLDMREGEKDLYRKSTTDAIFALRILMEKYRDGQRELHCVFVHLEKAYDRVPREELWYCMRKSGVAEKYVRVVQDLYERSRTVVRCAVGQTEEFKVEVGLHQGSALGPFLFAMVMDQLSEEVRQESPWTMMFADDIVICSESREQVEENLERWRFALERGGIKVSRSKTEYMCVNEREGSGTVRLQGEEVKKVQEFKYLGSTVQSNGECGKECNRHWDSRYIHSDEVRHTTMKQNNISASNIAPGSASLVFMDLDRSAGGGSTVAFRSKHMVTLAEALRKAELHKNDLELELQILEEAAELVVEEECEEQVKKGQQEQTKQCEDEDASSSSSEEEEENSSSEDHDSNSEKKEEEEQKGVPDGLAMTCSCSQELEHGESLIRELGERLEEELTIREDVPQITVPSSSTVREEEGEVEGLRETDDSQFPEAPDGIKIAKAASDTDLVEHRQCNVRILNTEELDSDDEGEDQPNQ